MLCLGKIFKNPSKTPISFGVDTPVCTECLNKLWKLQIINKIVYKEKLLEDIVRKMAWDIMAVDGKIMIDKRRDEVLAPEACYTCYKNKF